MADRFRRSQDDHRVARPPHAPLRTSSKPATKAGASRTAPNLQETVPQPIALAPAPQPRPVPPGRALPVLQARRGVNFGCRSGVNFVRRLTNGLAHDTAADGMILADL